MGIPDNSLIDLLVTVRSWLYRRGASDLQSFSREFEMPDKSCNMCCECHTNFNDACHRYHCQSCGRWFCGKCILGCESLVVELNRVETNDNLVGESTFKCCKFCSKMQVRKEVGRKYSEKVHPSVSPRESPEPPSPCVGGERIKCPAGGESVQSDSFSQYIDSRDYGHSPHAVASGSVTSFSAHPSPVSVRRYSIRSDEEEADDSGKHFYSPSSEYFLDSSDIDSISFSARNESCSQSVGSSPYDSPSRIDYNCYRIDLPVQKMENRASRSLRHFGGLGPVLKRPDSGTEDPDNTDDCSDDLSTLHNQYERSQRPLNFENNGLLWYPPPPEDENDEVENGCFVYDDDDDDIGDSGAFFSSSGSVSSMFPAKERHNEGNKEPLRAVVQGHFRALVSQLLQGEGIKIGQENGVENWLDIVTAIAWQAASFVKPDTSKGGSMDPGDYVKVKCLALGSPSDSVLVKGVVCSKNIKHKRMTSQYKNPRIIILGGALEYQRVPNQLASFDTLLQQENDHLKMIISKIEALRPNVLLVEKSVSSYAQEYLLTKEISLVLNVKRPLLERIARCTGSLITPSIDSISTTRLGHCELFKLEKFSEEHETANQFNKKPSKTLMFFEGCPRRLCCTVLLKGACREELKKVKHVVQYAVFAAYHLSLETSFLADEGASLPKIQPISVQDRSVDDPANSVLPDLIISTNNEVAEGVCLNPGLEGFESFPRNFSLGHGLLSTDHMLAGASNDDLASNVGFDSSLNDTICRNETILLLDIENHSQPEFQLSSPQDNRQLEDIYEMTKSDRVDENDVSSEYFSAADTHQSILVSFSSHCVLKGTICERSQLMRIKFYGCFDKPLGRYLRDDLFDPISCCRSCKEPAESHVLCYTHQQGNLTIYVRCLPSLKLPGERDGKIWMWHRCLRCTHVDGVPPATRRVVMSDAAWGLSFGKFLELSFSNHATANRVASCGHSLQKDCLRYYGFGSKVAFFRYSPIDILSVHLPSSMLEFNGHVQPDWIRKEATQLMGKMETLYAEVSDVLDHMEDKSQSFGNEFSDTVEMQNHIIELKDLMKKERNDYFAMLQLAFVDALQEDQSTVDILELNRLMRSLLVGSRVWDRRFYVLDSLLKRNFIYGSSEENLSFWRPKQLKSNSFKDCRPDNASECLKLPDFPGNDLPSEQKELNVPVCCEPGVTEECKLISCHCNNQEETIVAREIAKDITSFENTPSHESTLSERIDSAWTGTDQLTVQAQPLHNSYVDGIQTGPFRQAIQCNSLPIRRLQLPLRVHSFDSALRVQERIQKGFAPSSMHVSSLRSFHASGDYRSMIRDPVSSVIRTYSQILPQEVQKLNLDLSSTPLFISSASNMFEGVRMLLPHIGQSDVVIAVYDDEPTSIISYALSSKEYNDWVAGKSNEHEVSWNSHELSSEESAASTFSAWRSFGSMDIDYIRFGSGAEDAASSMSSLFTDTKKSPHLRLSFGDDKVKFSVTCYFAELFDSLRKKCCPTQLNFIRSLSRCRRWSAQGGKSNVYFAKSLDERFIIKQVKKTELESFEEFAPAYFQYLTDSLNSGSPTCLAKVLGIYQVSTKHLKGGKETKTDLMVMENLFFKRSISRVYDLKGSARSRYNSDTTGANQVLLDMNLLETLRTKPIFLGSKAKRILERPIWNDTSFLASVDVMDYSLLVGVDEERKELVLGIIDFMRQYTWDKHLETWVKASGILGLGGAKNASPTIISPEQYKKRFRKAMTTYFRTVPDQWSS